MVHCAEQGHPIERQGHGVEISQRPLPSGSTVLTTTTDSCHLGSRRLRGAPELPSVLHGILSRRNSSQRLPGDEFHLKCTCVGNNDKRLQPFVHDRHQVGPASATKSEENSVAKAADVDQGCLFRWDIALCEAVDSQHMCDTVTACVFPFFFLFRLDGGPR